MPNTYDVSSRGTEPNSATKVNIINHARALWAKKNYHAVSLRNIAAVSNVSLALITHYFGSKAQLYEKVIERLADAWSGPWLEERSASKLLALAAERVLKDPACRELVQVWLTQRVEATPEIRVMTHRTTRALLAALDRAYGDEATITETEEIHHLSELSIILLAEEISRRSLQGNLISSAELRCPLLPDTFIAALSKNPSTRRTR